MHYTKKILFICLLTMVNVTSCMEHMHTGSEQTPTDQSLDQKNDLPPENQEILNELLYHVYRKNRQRYCQEARDQLAQLGLELHVPAEHLYTILTDVLPPCSDLTMREIESGAALGKHWALQKKAHALWTSRYHYHADPNAKITFHELESKITATQTYSRSMIEEYITLGHEWAIRIKINGLKYSNYGGVMYGNYGYEKNTAAAHELIEHYAQLNCEWALKDKVLGLCRGDYGYPREPDQARALIEQYAALDHDWAFQHKAFGLYLGAYGYLKDLSAGHALIEEHAVQERTWALEVKSWGLEQGVYGYEKDADTLHALVEKYSQQGQSWALSRKVEGLDGKDFGSASRWFGYIPQRDFMKQYVNILHNLMIQLQKERAPIASLLSCL